MAEPGEQEPERPPARRDTFGGTIAGQKFNLETQHLVTVLLIVVVAGAMYFQMRNTAELSTQMQLLTQMQKGADSQIERLRGEHEQMSYRMTLLGNALRVVDWNQNRPIADRVPIDLPAEMFEKYRREAEPEEEPARRRPAPESPRRGSSRDVPAPP